MLHCENCGAGFDRPRKSKRVTCTRSCAVSLSWKNEGTRELRSASIRVAVNAPQNVKRIIAENHKRWARPGERDKLSEQNRREWSDQAKAESRTASIKAANSTPEKRELYSKIADRKWSDANFRERAVEGMRRNHPRRKRDAVGDPAHAPASSE